MLDANIYNGLTLAYIGDAYFELIVREQALQAKLTKVNSIHNYVTARVNSKAQANYINQLIANNLLTDLELSIYNRGRNAHVNSVRKIDLKTYHEATGFEALIGYLYLTKNFLRIEEICNVVLKGETTNGS